MPNASETQILFLCSGAILRKEYIEFDCLNFPSGQKYVFLIVGCLSFTV